MTIFVSVIVPTYHDWIKLEQCLNALARQTLTPEQFEVVVVNNDPQNRPPANFQLPSNAILIEEGEPGSYAARNRGVRESRGEILVFTDADCLPDPKWLESGIDVMLNNKIARLAGHVELFRPEGGSDQCYFYEKVISFNQEKHAEEGTSVTANMFARKEVFEAIGLFNPKSFSGEDTQWGLRAQQAGYSIGYSRNAKVLHPARRNLRELVNKSRRTYGGWYRIKNYDASLGRKILSCILAARPPIRQIGMLASSREVPAREKIQVLYVLLYLRCVRFYEHLRLALGKTPERG